MLPPSTITMDSTEAKIGRLMKNRENTIRPQTLPSVQNFRSVGAIRRPVATVDGRVSVVRRPILRRHAVAVRPVGDWQRTPPIRAGLVVPVPARPTAQERRQPEQPQRHA